MKKFGFLMPIGLLAIPAIFSTVVMLLWNWLMPALFGLAPVGFWQALGILILCRILFGSFGGGHGLMKHVHHRGEHHFRDKWQKMTPEQRKEFFDKRKEYINKAKERFERFAEDDFSDRHGFNHFATDRNMHKNNE
jgi:hypothetical protein